MIIDAIDDNEPRYCRDIESFKFWGRSEGEKNFFLSSIIIDDLTDIRSYMKTIFSSFWKW